VKTLNLLYLDDVISESHNSSHYAEYESKIQEFMACVARQDETLKAQAIQILDLTRQHSTKTQQLDNAQQVVLELQSSENAITVDPNVAFTELTARIDKAIHANKWSPDGVDTKQSTQPLLKGEIKSHHSLSRRPDSINNVPSHVESRGGPESMKQNVMITNSKHSTDTLRADPQEESSSESLAQRINIRTGSSSMYELIDQELNNSDKGRSPQGSRDSGLDSPKRFSTTPIRKMNTVQGSSLVKNAPVMDNSKDRVDNVDETGSEAGEGEGEKEETTTDDTTADQTETETDTGPESVLR
jgi:hypothetical protein